jgi:DNA-binding FadR family transcriptional regulator
MAIDYQGLVTQGLARQISEKLRDAILEGRLQVDERLPTEEELATRFSVSRPTIREALKRLAAQNLIRSRRGPAGGTFVSHPTQEEARLAVANAASLFVSMGVFALTDVTEARREIELVCCRLAATRRTETQLAALDAEVDRQRDASLGDADFCASDVAFHRLLVSSAGNPALDYAAAGMIDSLQPAGNMVVFRLRNRREVATQHARISQCLAARDPGGACDALEDYFETLRRQYRRVQSARDTRRTTRQEGRSHG